MEVLLIDNSDDGTGEYVADLFPDVRVIDNHENLGFGRANNRLAAAARAERLLLLNPDTYLRGDALDRLVEFSKSKPNAGAWGGKTVTPGGVSDAGNRLAFPTFLRLLRWAFGDGRALEGEGLPPDAAEPVRVDVLPGGFMMVRRDVWRRLGGFDESFFLYSEEIDFFLRLRREGFEAWATPDAVVTHDAGSGDRMSAQRLLYRTKGQAHFVRKHWTWPKASAAVGLLWFGFAWRWAASAALGALLPGKGSRRWRARTHAYGGLVRSPWRWWRGYSA